MLHAIITAEIKSIKESSKEGRVLLNAQLSNKSFININVQSSPDFIQGECFTFTGTLNGNFLNVRNLHDVHLSVMSINARNSVQGMGVITSPFETKTAAKQPFEVATLVIDNPYGEKKGTFYNIVNFGGENPEKLSFIKEQQSVIINAEYTTRGYTNSNGEKRSSLSLVIKSID